MASGNDFEPVATVSQIPREGVLAIVKSDGQRVCLIRSRERISAVADNCTHQDFEMALGDVLPDGTIQCAWHGARFDCATGEVKQGPALRPLPVFEVRVEGDEVLVGPMAPRTDAGHEPCVATVSEEEDR
jgi:Ferredoxin subunits of nitrite reductase and ring-hydroxylating dioxygenases